MKMRQVSILSLYLKHSGILVSSIMIALIAFLFLARRQMEPSFQVDIQHKLVEGYKTREDAIADILVVNNTTAVDEFLKNPEFIPSAVKKLYTSSDKVSAFEDRCHGRFVSESFGKMCIDSMQTSIRFPIDAHGNILGYLEVTQRGSVDSWLPYQRMRTSILTAIGLMALIALMLALQFYRFTVLPVKKTLLGIQEASDRGDFESILKSLPYTELFDITRNLSNKSGELMQAKHKAKLGDVATQIAHDIESPLAALMSVAQHSEKLPKDQRELINSAASRIHNLTDELLKQYRNETKASETSHTFVCSVIRSVLAEKNVQLENNPNIHLDSKILCALGFRLVKVPQNDLARILSNLINNSIQALPEQGGHIKVIVDSIDNQRLSLSVEDDGLGMTDEVLKKVLTEGGSYSKNGSGLGLRHAREVTQRVGGSIKIESKLGVGTRVTLQLPVGTKPAWLTESIEITENETVVVMDDDPSIRMFWKRRLRGRKMDILKSFSDFSIENYQLNKTIFIFDYEMLGSKVTGLDLIESHQLRDRAILVTSYFNEPEIQRRVELLGAKLLPKFMISKIEIKENRSSPIKIESEKPTVVLIDDNTMIRKTWDLVAKESNTNMISVRDEKEFDSLKLKPQSSIRLYIDQNLDKGVKGLDVAQRLHKRGFQNIFLSTGEKLLLGKTYPFLKGIVGKQFPLTT